MFWIGICVSWDHGDASAAHVSRFCRRVQTVGCSTRGSWSYDTAEVEASLGETKELRKSRRITIGCRLAFFGEDDLEGEGEMLDLSFTGCMAKSDSVLHPWSPDEGVVIFIGWA